MNNVDVFRKLGVRVSDCEGYMRSTSDILRDVISAVSKIQEGPKPEPLLTIELENETAIPKVFYKGEEISNRIQINFDWVTKELRNPGGMKFNLEYGDEKGIVHTKGRRRGEFI